LVNIPSFRILRFNYYQKMYQNQKLHRMRQLILILLFVILPLQKAISCTTFVLKNGQELVFGRNLDWVSDNGIIVVNHRNIQKTSLVFPPDTPTIWTSMYGSISFNQFGKEFPFGGMNEKGLVVEIMRAPALYPSQDNRSAVNELQWIQYQLDNCKNIAEVIQSNKKIRISKINQNLHFLVCDASGKTAVLEFIDGKMKVYTGKDLPQPVLENDPYALSLDKYKNKQECRFTTATDMVKKYPIPDVRESSSIVDYSFDILEEVALAGSWSIVYDIQNLTIHFKTESNQKVRRFSFNDFDFNCSKNSLVYDLKRKDSENIKGHFESYSDRINSRKFQDGLKTNDIQLPREVLNRFRGYVGTCECT